MEELRIGEKVSISRLAQGPNRAFGSCPPKLFVLIIP